MKGVCACVCVDEGGLLLCDYLLTQLLCSCRSQALGRKSDGTPYSAAVK